MSDKIQKTGKIAEGFYLINEGFVCSYLLAARDRFIAFDSGIEPKTIVLALTDLSIDPAKVDTVLLTHSDRDHIGGRAAFPNAQAFISKAEEVMLDHSHARFLGITYNKPLPFEYSTLEPGQELLIDDSVEIRCLHTPGHTTGSMSFLIDDSILIVGDECNLRKGKAVLNMRMLSIDNNMRRDSIKQLAKLEGISLLCTAHSGYTANFSSAMKKWRS
ncbi:MAG: MBL fold metallo-hydrolase [Spirochaetes bacterium]|nr:MBL fold metallo-hydrolase [Spirochaetota bacterium]